MNKTIKISLLGLLSLCVMLGMGGVAQAAITIGSAAITGTVTSTWSLSNGALTISTDGTTDADDLTISTAAGLGDVIITAGDNVTITAADDLLLETIDGNVTVTPGVVGNTITIGRTDGTGAITLGVSTGEQTLNLGTGTGASTVNIATGAGTNTITIGGVASGLVVDTVAINGKIVAGTSGTPLDLSTTATNKAIAIYTTSASTNGSTTVLPAYVNATMTAAAGVGRALEAYLKVDDVALGAWSNALKGYIDFNDSGSVAGLGSAICAEMKMPAGAMPGSGTYGVMELELDCPTTWSGTNPVSFVYAEVSGNTAANFDDNGYLLNLQGLTDGDGHLLYDPTLKIKVGTGTKYLVMSDAQGKLDLGATSGGIVLRNDAEITNTTDGTLTITEPTITLVGTTGITLDGTVTLDDDATIADASDVTTITQDTITLVGATGITLDGTVTLNDDATIADASDVTTITQDTITLVGATGITLDGTVTLNDDATIADASDATTLTQETITLAGSTKINLDGPVDLTGKLSLDAQGGTASDSGLLIGIGTAGSPATTDVGGAKFIELRAETTATTGDNRLQYMRYYMNGVNTTGGECLKAGTVLEKKIGTARGGQASIEVSDVGYVSGFACGWDALLEVTNKAVPSGGTYCAGQSQIMMTGSSSTLAATSQHSIHRFSVFGGDATAEATVLNAFSFDVENCDGDGLMVYTHTGDDTTDPAGSIRILVNGTARYLRFWTAQN